MGRNKELVKNTAIIAVGKICTQFVTFLLLPIYTRFLTTEEYGTIDLIIIITNLIAPIISLQLERSIFRFLIDARDERDRQDIIISTSLMTIASTAILSAVAIPIICLAAGIQYFPYVTALTILIIATNALLQIPRGLGKTLHFSIASAIIGILTAALGIFFTVFLKAGIEGVLLSNIIAHSVGAIYLVVTNGILGRVGLKKRDRATLREMLKFSIPMIPSDIVYWVISVSDRILIAIMLGSTANGIYAASVKIPSLIVTAYNVFNLSWIEAVSVHIRDSDASKYLSAVTSRITYAACSICCLVTAIMPFIFNIIIGPDYSEAYRYISILNIGAFFNIMIGAFSAIYFGLKRTKDIAKSNILAAILNIVINLALIHFIGVYAAAISTALAYLIVTIHRLIDIQSTTAIRFNIKAIIISGLIILLNSVAYLFNDHIINIINLIVTILVAISLNFRIIISSVNIAKNKISRRRNAEN